MCFVTIKFRFKYAEAGKQRQGDTSRCDSVSIFYTNCIGRNYHLRGKGIVNEFNNPGK